MSVYSVSNVLADASTVANFNTFFQPISDALSSSNFDWMPAYSASTVGGAGGNGARITWASVTAVPTSQGDLYEIWGMNDANQTGCPFYMRLDYWNDGSNNHVQVSVGQGYSSGTGLLTNTNGQIYNCTTNSNGGGTTYTHYLSGSTSSFRMQLCTDKAGDGILMIVERSKSSTGSDTAAYVSCGMLANTLSSNSAFVVVPATGTLLNACTRWPVPVYDVSTSAAFGTNVAVFPILPVSTTVGAPLLGAGVVKYADFSTQSNANISVVAYGSSHTYKVMNNTQNQRAMYDTSDASVLMQYE